MLTLKINMDLIIKNIDNMSISPKKTLWSLKESKKFMSFLSEICLKAREMTDFLTFFERKHVIEFLTINYKILTRFKHIFFYEDWGTRYVNVPNLEKLRLGILHNSITSYISIGPKDTSDIYQRLQHIISIHEEILLINHLFT